MRVVITGSESFIGRNLIPSCLERGIEVIGIDFHAQVKSEYEFHSADIRSPDIQKFIPKNTDAIIHLAALSRDPDCKNNAKICFDVNVMGTINLSNASLERKVNQFIFASSEWVYGNFKSGEIKDEESIINISEINSEYALSKLVSENNLRQKYYHGFCPVTVLRFGIIYGPRESNWSAVESIFNQVMNNEVTVGSLKSGRCFIHVDDITTAILQSIGIPDFQIFNIAADRFITLGEVIEESKQVLGLENVNVTETNAGNISTRSISNHKAVKILSWKPEVNLNKGLRSLL